MREKINFRPRFPRFAAACFGVVLFVAGCALPKSRSTFETAFRHPPANFPVSAAPIKLKLAVNDIYCADTSCSCVRHIAHRDYRSLLSLLKKRYGIDARLDYFIDPYDFDTAVASGKYDGAISKPWRVYAIPSTSSFKRVADIADPEGNRWLRGIFLVRKSSKIRKLEDLRGKLLAMGNPSAYEKSFAALHELAGAGLAPGDLRIKRLASCLESIGELLDGKVDSAVVSDYALAASCAVDIAKPEDFRIIAETDRIPLTSVMLDLSKVYRNDAVRVRKALLKLSAKGAIPKFSGVFLAPASWKVVLWPEKIK